uniref:Uncharacterized protein n=1 Tax=Arundo donax TaxID=35708 RepID=A0A0A8ZJ22_ARUDO
MRWRPLRSRRNVAAACRSWGGLCAGCQSGSSLTPQLLPIPRSSSQAKTPDHQRRVAMHGAGMESWRFSSQPCVQSRGAVPASRQLRLQTSQPRIAGNKKRTNWHRAGSQCKRW